MKRKITLAILLSLFCMVARAGFTPVVVTGFNEDIVANGTAGVAPSISSNLTLGFDSAGHSLVSQDYVDSNGSSPAYHLPASGLVSSVLTGGLTFQLASYSSNNALYLSDAGSTGTLTFATPQSAGSVYLVGTSSSASAFDVVVNFSDGSSQTFAGNEFFDWYQGTASVPGIGRVSDSTGLADGTSTNPHLFQLNLVLDAGNTLKLITGVTINKLNSATHLAIMGVTLQSYCSGTPVLGSITSTQSTGCSFYNSALSTTNDTTIGGIAYQWQSSNDGITYSNVPGATSHIYNAPVSATIFYRDSITCLASNLWAYSPDTELVYTSPMPVAATLPYFQSFESWFGTCYNYDRPDSSWTLNPTSGNYSWRRDDQGADAAWSSPDLGAYTPLSTDGAHSARFHTYFHVTGLTEGDMDLHINLSTPGTKQIVFDYLNETGTGYLDDNTLTVELSEDGGATFPTTLATYTTYGSWEQKILTTNSTAANAVIRFAGERGQGDNDLGIDSVYVSLLPSCSGAPVAGTFSATQSLGCVPYTATLSVDAPVYATGISYQWQSSTDGATYTDISGATGLTYSANVTATIYYRFFVVCATSTDTVTSSAQQLQLNTPQVGVATLPYFQSFENWVGSCSPVYRPDSNWVNDSTTGNDSWRRDDQGADANWTNANGVPDATDGGYTPASTDGAHSARFHNYAYSSIEGPAPTTTGTLDLHVNLSPVGTKEIAFDCIGTSGDDLTISLSEDGGTTFTSLGTMTNTLVWTPQIFTTNSVSPNAVIRITGHNSPIYDLNAGTALDMGIDSFAVFVSPNCDGMPTAGTFSNTQSFGCVPFTSTLTVDNVNAASGIVYQWQTSTDGINFTDIPGANAPLYSASITDSIYYRFYVVCTNSNDTDSSAATQFILTPQPVDTATLPYTQGFENWSGICYTYGRPDSNWSNSPAYGDASWRRDDQGSDAGWDNTGGGVVSPASTQGSHCARFHSNAASLEEGDLDVHLNLNQPGQKNISFDYNLWNPTPGTNSGNMLIVEFSENGGASFDTLATYLGGETGWTSQILTTTSVSTDVVLRFAGFGAFNAFPTAGLGPDIGLDNLNVELTPPCDTVMGASVSNVTQNSATVNWTAVGGSIGYDVIIDQTPTPTGLVTYFLNEPPYLATGLLSGTTYYAHIRDSCGPNSSSNWVTVAFTTGTVCDTVMGVTVSNVTQTGATVNWTAVGGSTGYDVVVDQSSSSPAGSGTFVASPPYNASGLTDTTVYYAHVRDSCGPGNASGWVTVMFTTLATPPPPPATCDSIMGLSVTGVGQNSATISWTAVSGTAGYEIVVSTSSTNPPTGGITGVGTNSYNATGLTDGTVYYVFVRDSCDTNSFSGWDTLSFTTLPLGVANVNNSQFGVQVYPNPAKDIAVVTVYGAAGNNKKISLLDVTGRVISTVNMPADKESIDMSNLAAGIYLIRYEDDTHTRIIKLNKQ